MVGVGGQVMAEPYAMIEAMRRAGFKSKEEANAWLMTPNADIGGLRPAEAASRGLYGAVVRAVDMKVARDNRPTYRTIEG
jgi:hypothetical protein